MLESVMVTKNCMNSGGRSSAGFGWTIGRMREIGRLGERGSPEGGCFGRRGSQEALLCLRGRDSSTVRTTLA